MLKVERLANIRDPQTFKKHDVQYITHKHDFAHINGFNNVCKTHKLPRMLGEPFTYQKYS